MTRYILHGGNTQVKSKKNKRFFQTIIHGQKNPTILCIYFARDLDCWEEKFAGDQEMFAWANPHQDINYIIASDDSKVFLEQIKKADILYIRGGYTGKLMKKLKAIREPFIENIKGKTIVGSSAGAYALSTYCITTIDKKLDIYPGLGIIPIKTIAHYSFKIKKRRKRKKLLKAYSKDLPLYTMKNESYYLFHQ